MSTREFLEVKVEAKRYRGNLDSLVLGELKFNVPEGEIFGVFGPSGCGKSTLARMIGGLDTDFEGVVQIDGKQITGPSSGFGLTPQTGGGFPWLTIGEIITMPLWATSAASSFQFGRQFNAKDAGQLRKGIKRGLPLHDLPGGLVVQEELQTVGLAESDLTKLWDEISGGMRQRAMMARTALGHHRGQILDEALSALDYEARHELQDVLLAAQKSRLTSKTYIVISHDPEELLYLCDEIVVLTKRPATVLTRWRPNLGNRSPELRYTELFQDSRRRLENWLRTATTTAIVPEDFNCHSR